MRLFRLIGLVLGINLLTILSIINPSFAYFDEMKLLNDKDISLGNWNILKQEVTSNELTSFIQNQDNTIIIDNKVYDMTHYYSNELFFYKNEIQCPFLNYSIDEIKKTHLQVVNNIKTFANATNEKKLRLNENTDSYLEVKTDKLPNKQESCNYYGYMLTYDLKNKSNKPITLNVRLYSPSKQDLSNYALELLFDTSVFALNNPLSYLYKIKRDTQVIDFISEPRLNDVFSLLNSDEVYYLNNTLHKTNKPLLSGNFARLKDGNYLNNERMVIEGSKNGEITELSITILNNNPKTKNGISAIPFALSLSNSGDNKDIKIDYQVYSGSI